MVTCNSNLQTVKLTGVVDQVLSTTGNAIIIITITLIKFDYYCGGGRFDRNRLIKLRSYFHIIT